MFTIPEFLAARKPGSFRPLRCPHCQKLLNPLGPLVLATHNCPHCGRHVLAEPEGAAPALTLAQLDGAHAACERARSRMLRRLLFAVLAWFVVVLVAGLFRDALRDALGSQGIHIAIVVAAALIPTLVAVAVARRIDVRNTRAAPKCPHCNTAIYHFARFTRITGNCFACGKRVAELPPDEPTGPLPTVDEYKAAERRANRSVGATVFLCAVVAAILGGLSTFANPDRMIAALEPQYGAVTAAVIGGALMVGWVVGLIAVAVGGMWYFTRRQRQRREADPVLSCPRCHSELGMAFQAVATRRCPECRARTLADPEPVGVADEPAGG